MRKQLDKEGDLQPDSNNNKLAEEKENYSARLLANPADQQQRQHPSFSFRCQYYGCKSKSSAGSRFVCLNYTQICDDFIDCQDESDELDCVSLLKYDDIPTATATTTTTTHTNHSKRLNFSNGAGIIYLNRRGSLAPMCVDYFPDNQQSSQEKQQELIRQINTIGQYACSLQSFSRLVSVKINRHELVDGFDLIKNSKLYHRLSIVGPQKAETSALSR